MSPTIFRMSVAKSYWLRYAGVLGIACLSSLAHAEAVDEASRLSVSGFGTIGAMYHRANGVEYRRDILASSGAPSHQWSLDQDSKLGVQADVRLSDELDATLQLVSRNRYATADQPQFTWAFLKWKARPDTTLRAGRLGLDLYMLGDTSEIGYANLGLSSGLYPQTADGVDAEWTELLDGGIARVKTQIGQLSGRLRFFSPSPSDSSGTRLMNLVAEYSKGAWVARFNVGRAELRARSLDPSVQQFFSALSVAPRGAEIRDILTLDGRRQNYFGVGLGYDSGPAQILASACTVSSDRWADVHFLKVHAGYRVGRWTPYILHLREWTNRSFIQTGIPWGLTTATDSLNQAALIGQAAIKANQAITSIGLRHDLSRNLALKVQLDSVRYQDASSVVDRSLPTADVLGREFKQMTVYSMALEFLF